MKRTKTRKFARRLPVTRDLHVLRSCDNSRFTLLELVSKLKNNFGGSLTVFKILVSQFLFLSCYYGIKEFVGNELFYFLKPLDHLLCAVQLNIFGKYP